MADPKEMKHREIDHEKSLRQMKGLDGDAIEEDHRIERTHDHHEVFDADAAGNPRKKPSDAEVVAKSGAARPADDVDLDRAA